MKVTDSQPSSQNIDEPLSDSHPPLVSQTGRDFYQTATSKISDKKLGIGNTGVIAIDLDALVERYGKHRACKMIQTMISSKSEESSQSFTFIAVTQNPHWDTEKVQSWGLDLPVVINDYTGSPFGKKTFRGFGETQLEKIKELKFDRKIPIVGVISRPVAVQSGYVQSGIELIPLDQTMNWGQNLPALLRNVDQFTAQKTNPNFRLDGLTGSEAFDGNDIRFYPDNDEAKEELLWLIDSAHSFIDVSSFAIEDDPDGREIVEHLMQRARDGIAVRILVDEICLIPYGSDYGFVWMTQDLLAEMKASGIETVFHHLSEKPHADQPWRGPLVRRHRKAIVVDQETENGIEFAAFGGGRVLGSVSFSHTKSNLQEVPFWAQATGMGWGGYHDLSYVVRGPAAWDIHEKLEKDFEDYGLSRADHREDLYPDYDQIPSDPVELRYITHDSFANQNCLAAILDIIRDPKAKEVTLVNSFTPSEILIEAMIKAARDGKKVRWIFGSLYFENEKRQRLIPRLIAAGINVHYVPYQLHTKLYANDFSYAFGNHNLDEYSQRDAEDLMMMTRDESEASTSLDDYVTDRLAESYHLNSLLPQSPKVSDVVKFMRSLPASGTNCNDAELITKEQWLHPLIPSQVRLWARVAAAILRIPVQ